MSRVAAIDVGSNSVRLLIAEVENGRVKPLHTGLVTTRLGKKMNGRLLLPETVERTIEVLAGFLTEITGWGVERVGAVATSAVREAANGGEFVELVRRTLGLEIDVLSGDEEALLGYQGVCGGLPVDPDATVVVDIGGGSTEFTWRGPGGVCCRSLMVGAVRMTEGGYTDGEIAELLAPVLEDVRAVRPEELVAVGGTATTLAAMSRRLTVYDPHLVHGYRLTLGEIEALLLLLRHTPLEERCVLPGLQPERADIIEAGARILRLILIGCGRSDVLVSEADILYGLAAKVAGLSK